MKFAFYTLGCKTNQYDSEAMLERLMDGGYELAREGEPADVVIVNTCTVTA
ncbi:MAG: tRNA (N(6)-L-threonylcarbamoyladenosine(37)-C(2))-methylthiotransferase MtaB, partial [Oscillospiraceae bacterium]|nr:tRNA (N(6)-L-threonylcarbamoyladenosine(37)-C(2))-methylthiotransferase MtaB [Oscillospiraceae bacterium]